MSGEVNLSVAVINLAITFGSLTDAWRIHWAYGGIQPMPITPSPAKREWTGCLEYPANDGDGDDSGLESLERSHKRFQKNTRVFLDAVFFYPRLGQACHFLNQRLLLPKITTLVGTQVPRSGISESLAQLTPLEVLEPPS